VTQNVVVRPRPRVLTSSLCSHFYLETSTQGSTDPDIAHFDAKHRFVGLKGFLDGASAHTCPQQDVGLRLFFYFVYLLSLSEGKNTWEERVVQCLPVFGWDFSRNDRVVKSYHGFFIIEGPRRHCWRSWNQLGRSAVRKVVTQTFKAALQRKQKSLA